MGKISARMKRMLAIILVEVIVASNVFVSYADESDGPRVIAEMTMEEADAYAAEQEEEQQEESSEEEITEETSEEEGAAEEGAGEDESPAAEGEEAGETETPGSEETPEASETPAEGSESGEGGDVIAVLPQPEEKTECICENKCTAEEYNSDCPVCSQAETAEDAEAFLTENCKGMEAAAEEPTQEPEEKEETVKAEIVEVDNSVSVTAVCKADGEVIEGSDDLTITVDGVVNVPEKAPTIEGYTFSGKVSLENGDSISQLKKETTEEKEESDVDGEKVITKITKTTSMSYSDGTEWKALSEDITIVFEYTKDETATEETAEVKFTASYVDLDGNAIEGYESKPLTFENTLDLTKEPEKIENYKYVEAKIDGKVVSSINKKTETDEDGKEITSYCYTTAGTDVEVTADKEIIFVYEAEAKEVVITLNVVDEEGLAIEGYAETTLPEFENELALDDPEKAPVAVEGYIYKEATVNGNVITALVKETSEEAKASGYSYVTETGESVAIEEDTEITLAYEEEEIVVAVDASVVDEFGDAIADKYTGMDISKIFDGSDELVLDDPETPPVAKVQVRKSLFKVIKYTYVKATVDKEIITGLKREVTKDTAELKDKKKEYIYSYTTDGETWTKIKKDTTVIFEYTDGKKSVYTYEDANVLVTATLQHANAIPDDAEFVVTPVTSSSSDYNYDAYMNALNKNADKIDENADSKSKKDRFNEKNTLLYDIAFLAAPVDENGETIEGELVEYQPAEGMVNISVQFKQKQLEKDLKAEKSEDVTVVHMPLSDSAKEANATTAGATGISASDIQVEIVADSTSVSGEQVDFNLSDFSVVVFALNTASDDAFVPGTTRTYEDMLGSAKNIGLVANEITLVGHLETNLATASLHGYGPLQAPRNEGNAGETYIGAYDGSGLIIDANSSGAKMMVYTTLEAARNFGSNTVVFDQNGNITQLRNSLHLDTTSYTSSQIASMVSAMITQVRTNSTAAFAEENAYDFSKAKNDTIDIAGSNSAAGTYYVNFDAGEYKGQHLRISINSDQNVVLNIPDTSVSFGQFTCTIDGNSQTTQASTGDDPICQRVIFNCPNATYAQTSGVVSGTFVVPNATFENNSVAAGWLVANTIAKVGGQEWHCVYHGMPEPVVVTDQYQFSALKKVNNAAPHANENNKFTFSLYKLESNGETLVESKTNNGENIEFSAISTGEQAGTFWYVIRETGAVDGYTIDATPYYAKVVVEERTSDNSTEYVVTSKKYYRDAQGTVEVGTPTFNNTYKPEKIQISGSKTWDDGNNQDGIRPSSITVNLLKNGVKTDSKIVTSEDKWAYEWKDLPMYENGVEITYTVTEDPVEGYSPVYSGYDIRNVHTPGKTNISVRKDWSDSNNQDGVRPSSIEVQLKADGVAEGAPVTLNEENKWSYTWTDLAEKKAGKVIAYTVEEVRVPAGYKVVVGGDAKTGYILTNSHTPETTSIRGTKTWNDNNNQDGLRPQKIEITLYADGNVKETKDVTAADNWSWSFTNLPVYKDGQKIVYTISEKEILGYDTEVTGYDVKNTHTPEKTSVSGIKVWDDKNNQDGKRPETITVNLLADGTKVDSMTISAAEDGSWSYAFTDLDKFKDGREIVYTVTEEVTELKELGYSTSIDGTTITNSYTPGKTNHKVVKVWEDGDDQDRVRPESIRVQLLADGVAVEGSEVTLNASNSWSHEWTDLDLKKAGQLITYTAEEIGTVTGYETSEPATANGITTITNTHIPETIEIRGLKTWDDNNDQDGIRPSEVTIVLFANGEEYRTAKATKDNGWAYSFTDLPKYQAGDEISYTISEIAVDGYKPFVTVYDVKNTHTPETTSVRGSKVWDDANNQDGIRPTSITVNLLADNEVVKSMVVKPDSDGNWTYEFTNLPKYRDGGQPIVYTVTENAVNDYSTKIEGTVIKNSYTPEKTSHSVVKVWNDNNNQDGIRPDAIEVELYADGNVVTDSKVTLNAANNWSHTWEGLDLKSNGQTITYTAKEVGEITRYTVSSTTDAKTHTTTITNSYTPEKTSVSGKKTWSDADNQDGKRPSSITIRLLADGTETNYYKVVTKADDWKWSFTELPKYRDGGQLIIYTISEDAVAEYKTSINGYDVENTHIPEETSVSGEKTWSDANNQDGVRPDSIIIHLQANGETVQSKTVTEADNWKWNFTNLPKYANGSLIIYTITEEITSSYSADVKGFDVENSYTPGKTSLSVQKVWSDANNQDGIRPATVYVQLYADGQPVKGKTAELNAANGWTYTWMDLDEKKAGKTIRYEAKETEVSGYTVSYNNETVGTTVITNTHIPEETEVEGSKSWDDNNNQDGKRPESIKIWLLADGTEIDSRVVTEESGWKWSFTDLPKYKDGGKLISYTIAEDTVNEYITTINGYDVKNEHIPEKIDIEGTKTWDDEDNKYEARPSKIVIHLYADGKEIDERTIEPDESGNWPSWKFENLDKYKDGKEIKYTISEDKVTDYTAKVEGYDVINSYTPDWTEVTVTKEWDDEDNQDGLRPTAILVQLYEDKLFDKKVGDPVQLDVTNNWTYTWKNLPKSRFLGTINYTVKELGAVDANGETVELTHYTSKTVETTINNVVITNSHIPETVELSGKKEWDDADNQDGLRPESITIRLYADGEALEDKIIVVKPDEKGDWAWSFKDLPKYKTVNGVTSEIVYTITEDVVTDYETEIKEEAAENGKSFIVTNTHKPEVISINGTKTWDDADNQDNLRPESITINLFANGEKIAEKVVTQSDNWSWSFENLPKFEKGVEIVYLITEDVVEGYSAIIEGYDVINRHTPGKTSRTVTKVWRDSNNRDKIRPESISVQLYADGEAYGDAVVLNAGNKWSYTWENLDEKRAGKLIVYTVAEIGEVKGYTTSYSEDTFVITNSHTPRQEPTPTPDSGETPTPGDDTETPPGNQPTPSPTGEVLGAKRVEEGGAVLGARRGPQYAVLGKRRRPQTGDSMALILWAIALGVSATGAVISLTVMHYGKKRED